MAYQSHVAIYYSRRVHGVNVYALCSYSSVLHICIREYACAGWRPNVIVYGYVLTCHMWHGCSHIAAASLKLLHLPFHAIECCNTDVSYAFWGLCRYNMPESVDKATDYINYVFSIYFLVEMTIKMVGLGFWNYCADGMNCFDALVTVAGIVELIIDMIPSISGVSALSVMRAFRLMRVFRLARSWKSLNRIITILLSSFAAVSWLTLLLLLFMFICGLLGMQVRFHQLHHQMAGL